MLIVAQTWEHYSSVRKIAGPHTGLPGVHIVPEMISKKRPSPSVDGEDDDQFRRARKRRSPLPLFDSDSTPEGTESSSDESNGPMASQQSHLDNRLPEPHVKPQKLTIKLRGLRTTDADSPLPSRTSSPARMPAPPPLQSLPATNTMIETPTT
jgi:OTU domain-containing protein 3